MNKIKVQMVGNYYVRALMNLFPNNILVDKNIITGISPFSLLGNTDTKFISEWEEKLKDLSLWNIEKGNRLFSLQTCSLFDLKKNFSDFLSRDSSLYCDNVIFKQPGEEVKRENDADYVIIDLSSAIYNLIQYNNVLYTECWPNNPFISYLKSQPNIKRFSPAEDGFNWKYYLDLFVNAILEEFDSSHIILIKTQFSKFFYENGKIHSFPKISSSIGDLIKNIDNYFVSKTNCHIIDLLNARLPNTYLKNSWPYGTGLGNWQIEAVERIVDIIDNNKKPCNTFQSLPYNSSLAKNISKNIRSDKADLFKAFLDKVEEQRIPSLPIAYKNIQSDLLEDLNLLSEFIIGKNYKISDYIIKHLEDEILPENIYFIIEKYTKYFICDLNDIISIYKLYELSENKCVFVEIVKNICQQKDCEVLSHTTRIFHSNINYLSNYKYCAKSALPEEQYEYKKFINIQDNTFLALSDDPKNIFCLICNNSLGNFDHMKIIENGYRCSLSFANALTYSYDYYIEKAKRGDGSKPTYLEFENIAEFLDSLYYIDYSSLLENEKFVIDINGYEEKIEISDYVPIVDLSELTDPETAVVKVWSGLGDQLCYYCMGKIMEIYGHKKIIFDDIRCTAFNGLEIERFAKEPISLLSAKLSRRLRFFDIAKIYTNLISKFSEGSVYICRGIKRFDDSGKGGNLLLIGSNQQVKYWLVSKTPFSYYDVLFRIEWLKEFFDFNLRDLIEFPPFEKQEHIELAKRIKSCDSVVIHVRRGDYISFGWETDNEFYVESVQKVMKLDAYRNKKFFVFSDDIEWCRTHFTELGLDKIGELEVEYVDGNKETDSFRDIQLMALGKIMIMGTSYFPMIAALYNTDIEMFISADRQKVDYFQKYVKQNKYDIGSYAKNYTAIGHF